ncbi:glycoside hydrolase family 127 protein [Cohnella nanjingensis]|uniref:Glycoside hydrolase family 127 protein n=1 Tax=Cohnella nanjingensis TaxID=1387779 RepID=A0A7X0VI44_9BACL|nr:beta-L-arabinofuranosidase domain-containing protein [Cohnella nanjingensis]MBB6674827.1 glycoside hydrolase family 127 protein [Cohnella nanjingensis]
MTQIEAQLMNWQSVPFTKVKIDDAFWRPRLEVLSKVTIKTCLSQCEETGRISNFAKAAGLMEGEFEGIYFNDSDVYKVLEGAAYLLMSNRDPELEAEIDRIIELIAAAQEADGYLCTYYTLVAPESKWTDMEKHEMYNGGHLIEAAVAYYEATGKRKLLDVACRMVDHYDREFGPGKRHWVEGHEEIELALVKLYRVTHEERYWKLALWLLEERGHGHGKGAIWDKEEWGPAYCQDDVPVRDIEKVTGHAVRAMYLYTAMADVVHASGDPAYVDALHRVWAHTWERNMYVTGGIGPSLHNEGFTQDYDLPNETAYCETCAAVAMVFWNHRMNLLFGDAKYADVVEREMYNGALAGISLSGDKFFYVNPLASKGDHHRVEWFGTSCCPTNLVRYLPSIGQYAYARTDDGLVVNQFMNGEAEFEVGNGLNVKLKQTTNYPWDGKIELAVNPERTGKFVIRLRVPGWCRGYKLKVGGESLFGAEALNDRGYLALDREWSQGDSIVLELDMPVEVVRARAEVEANRGRLAIQRGPIIYCMEQADHPASSFDSRTFLAREKLQINHRPDLLGGVTVLTGRDGEGSPCLFIPYYAWDNREQGFMQVWIREAEDRQLYIY